MLICSTAFIQVKEEEDALESGVVSRKRARTGPDVPQKPPIRRRNPEFYYDDGNVTVAVEDMEFRMHLSRLRRHCTFFKPAADSQEDQNDVTLVDSIPSAKEDDEREVVNTLGEASYVLGGISIADFTEFLRAFENPLYVHLSAYVSVPHMPTNRLYNVQHACDCTSEAEYMHLAGARGG